MPTGPSICLSYILCGKCCKRSRAGRAVKAREDIRLIDPEQEFNLRAKPIFMIPECDIKGLNGIIEVVFGESESKDGIEVTVVFADEDRPSKCQDVVYDAIRRPLFGRAEDIETFTLVRGANGTFESIYFEGTYSGEQTWQAQLPKHETETVPMTEFVLEGERPVIWINVWNHLFGPRNNNPSMTVVRCDSYECTFGTRNAVDSRFCGLISKIA